MAADLLITISGMRGIVGRSLTPSVGADYGCAFGTFLKEKFPSREKLTVCVGRDSRPSGQMLTSAVAAGLCATGVNVIDLGVVTTPSVGVMTRHLSCSGAVIITASHNHAEYNGIKLLLDTGMAPASGPFERIKSIYLAKKFTLANSLANGQIGSNQQTDAVHLARVLDVVEPSLISEKRFKVVLDSVNGAGGHIGRELLTSLGCEVIAINNEPTGLFAHNPEPVAENLTGLAEAVNAHTADIGFAQDPDADRLVIVDETGKCIGEEYTLALAVKHVLGKTTGKTAVNLSTSRIIDDIAAAHGCEVIRTPVGEANVAEAMIQNNCVIGGEGNGGVIDLRVGPIRDSLVAMSLVLQMMAETGKSINQLVAEIPSYHMLKKKFPADNTQAKLILDSAKKVFADATLNTTDGCRFDFDDAWIHLRASNTEPIMRVIAEAKSPDTATQYIQKILDIRKKLIH